jgi:hypothetical protein
LPSIKSSPDIVLPPPLSTSNAAAEDDNSSNNNSSNNNMTRLGLHDEVFVAYSLLPTIRQETDITIHVDRQLYFARVRADGSIWLKDKPGFGRIKTQNVENVLGRKCLAPYEVPNDYGPGKWQIKCPPLQ